MSNQPFSDTLRRLCEERDLSGRQLSTLVRNHYPTWGSPVTLSRYMNGDMTPTMTAIERIATALNLDPDYFAEYRLGVARDQLDPEQVPLAVALKNLERFDR